MGFYNFEHKKSPSYRRTHLAPDEISNFLSPPLSEALVGVCNLIADSDCPYCTLFDYIFQLYDTKISI
jgi:hypothetical protein